MTRYDVSTSYTPQATSLFSKTPTPTLPQGGGGFVGRKAQATGVLPDADKIHKPQATNYKLQATGYEPRASFFASPAGEVAAKPPEGGGFGTACGLRG